MRQQERGLSGWFPRSSVDRSTGEAPSFAPAASPRLRRRHSPWPPDRRNKPVQGVHRTKRTVARCNPALIRQVRAGGFLERLSNTGSLSLRLPVLLAGPEPSDGADPSRHCQGCFPPSPPFRGSDCPQLHPAATTTRPRCPFITARFMSASWRTDSFTQKAVARLSRSRSIRRRALSLRSRASSAFSSVVSPSRSPRSVRAWRTQLPSVPLPIPKASATSTIGSPWE